MNQTVVVFTELPGTGKSTLAEAAGRHFGIPVFSWDWLRGSLADLTWVTRRSRARPTAAFALMEMLALRQLALGQSCALDAVVSQDRLTHWDSAISAAGGTMIVIHCVCPDSLIHQGRVEQRRRGIPGWHEVGWKHVEDMRRRHSPPLHPHLVMDSRNPLNENITDLLAFFPV